MNPPEDETGIAPSFVAHTLREMGYAAAPDGLVNPLVRLYLVEQALRDESLPSSPEARLFTLYNIMSNLVVGALYQRRGLYARPVAHDAWTLDDYRDAVQADMEADNADLMAFSLLYHCFIRVDLAISPAMFAAWSHVTDRTLRRYQAFAIKRLTHLLIDAERLARRQDRQRRLIGQLPSAQPPTLVGRDHLVETWIGEYADEPRLNVLITGASGIGKTALVLAVLHRLIAADCTAEVVWLQRPQSVGHIRKALEDRFIPDGSSIPLRDALPQQGNPAIIICDSCEDLLWQDAQAVDDILTECDTAAFILTSQVYQPLRHIDRHLALTPLDLEESAALVQRFTMPQDEARLHDEVMAAIFTEVGGVPGLLAVAARRLVMESWEQAKVSIHAMAYTTIYERLRKGTRLLWCALALLPTTFKRTEAYLWSGIETEAALTELRQWAVLPPEEQRIIESGARRFIEHLYAHDRDIQANIGELLAYVDKVSQSDVNAALPIVQHALLSDWLDINDERRLTWIDRCAEAGIRQGDAAIWCIILEQSLRALQPAEHLLWYGICLRRLGHWPEAVDVLLRALDASRHNQADPIQIQAHTALSMTLRYQGQYARAIDHLAQAETTARQYAPEQLPLVRSEQARIAIERGRANTALKLLAGLPENANTRLLRAESHLLNGEPVQARHLLEPLTHDSTLEPQQEATLYALIARSYEGEGAFQAAYHYFAYSLVVAETCGDRLTAGRAQSNIGAVLLRLGQLQRGRAALLAAQRELIALRDVVGIAAVQHNLNTAPLAGGTRSR
ncbi:MAG: tetratricopeptide repeat protein [bacterium]|nr:tetratricopeptide repeat protein [bacterium]